MRRRAFVATAALALSGGCLGYTVERREDVRSAEARAAELENESASRAARIKNLRDELSDRDKRVEELEARVEAAEGDADDERRRLVAYLYGRGISIENTAVGVYNGARSAFDESEYNVAEERLMRAYAYYLVASSEYGSAGNKADEGGWPEAEQLCEDASEHAALISDACWEYAIGADDIAAGGDGGSRLSAGDRYRSRANEIETVDLAEVENVLGVEA